uniref:P-type domain-containing protein n=1 Tax=Plectus sambesii TaxID=2011161 RepID=A0A914W3I0_9BILA
MLRLTCLAVGLLLGGINGQITQFNRIDCYPQPGANQQTCQSRGCIWDSNFDSSHPTVPLCYLPTGTGYTGANGAPGTYILTKKAGSFVNPYGADSGHVIVSSQLIGKTLNVRFVDQSFTNRYEPPIGIPKNPSTSSSNDVLQFNPVNVGNQNLFSFTVTRASKGPNFWDTSIGGLIFSDKYIQIATLLPSQSIYGFGEAIHPSIKHDFSRYTTWAMFARDEAPDSASALDTKNLYGVHPFYICVESDGKAHGVFILNSNAQEVTTGMAPHLIYRTIGGMLDLYFFPGPTPEEVVNQYLALIGTPMLPAYWSLGFQLCRWGYQSLQDIQAAVGRTQAAGIPLDVVFSDIDYMNHDEDFTTGSAFAGLSQYVDQLHAQGLHVTLIFDPAIEVDYDTFQRGLNTGARFIEWPASYPVPSTNSLYPMTANTKIMLGAVWPDRHTAFPDFLDENITQGESSSATDKWWAGEFTLYHSKIAFDGIWIDMNEPSNFGTNQASTGHEGIAPLACPLTGSNNALDSPPFQTQAVYLFGNGNYLSTKTLCMLGKTGGGKYNFYDTKSLYGWSEARATQKALNTATGKRGVVISRSTFPSAGRYTGHWLGDNTARWEDLRTSVIGAMEFNFFGIPYVGSDICGFIGSPTEELCLRWQQMGAFHPFSRNHNIAGTPPQDPAMWPSVAAAAKKALLFRYHYLPHLYSLHYDATLYGHTVLRPLFFEFPSDSATLTLDKQFLWGSAFLITPVLTQGANSVDGYFPSGVNNDEVWYSIYDFNYAQATPPGPNQLPAPVTSMIPVHVRGGYILPRQAPATTTTAAKTNPFELLVAIKGVRGAGTAQGQLYWDDGEASPSAVDGTYNYYKWNFAYSETPMGAQLTLQRVNTVNGMSVPTLDIIELFGYKFSPSFQSFALDGNPLTLDMSSSFYNASVNQAYIKATNLIDLTKLNSGTPSVLSWRHTLM